jgi:hypothetical protein
MAVFCFLLSNFAFPDAFGFHQRAQSCFDDHVDRRAHFHRLASARCQSRTPREQAAVTVIETAALSENSARFLELLSEIPEGASAATIEDLDSETRRQIFLFGLRVEVIGYMVFHGLVDVHTVNDLAGGAILSFWLHAKNWAEERRKRTGHDEFLEWCKWLATQIAQYRATRPYVPAYSRATE